MPKGRRLQRRARRKCSKGYSTNSCGFGNKHKSKVKKQKPFLIAGPYANSAFRPQ